MASSIWLSRFQGCLLSYSHNSAWWLSNLALILRTLNRKPDVPLLMQWNKVKESVMDTEHRCHKQQCMIYWKVWKDMKLHINCMVNDTRSNSIIVDVDDVVDHDTKSNRVFLYWLSSYVGLNIQVPNRHLLIYNKYKLCNNWYVCKYTFRACLFARKAFFVYMSYHFFVFSFS